MSPSQIGHGQLGVRDNLRTFEELAESSQSVKHALAEIRLGQFISNRWRQHSGGTYQATVRVFMDGLWRDIVAAEVATIQPVTGTRFLKRVEALAECVAEPGTYYFDPDSQTNPILWGDGTLWGQAGAVWGSYPQLYVHLGSDVVPTEVEAHFGFYYSLEGVVHPDLGDELFTDGGLEVWTSPTNLTNWTETLVGTGAVDREPAIVKAGTYSARLSSGNTSARISQDETLQAGAVYRFCGYYLTDVAQAVQSAVILIVNGASDVVLSDGRNWPNGGNGFNLRATNGQWRRFAFDFKVKTTGTHTIGIYTANASGAAVTYVDGLSLRRVWRYNYYEPRLAPDFPGLDTQATNLYFGGKSVGSGTVRLLAGDSRPDSLYRPETIFGNLDVISREVRMFHGGEFVDSQGGQELLIDDYQRGFTGAIRQMEWQDGSIVLECEDTRRHAEATLPTRSFTREPFANIPEIDVGRPIPLLFGKKTGIRPVRLDFVFPSGYGIYVTCDYLDSPNGIKSVDAVYAYVDEEAANKRDTTKRVQLSLAVVSGVSPHYSVDLASGTITILRDVQCIEMDPSVNYLDFNIGGAAKKAGGGFDTSAGVTFIADLCNQLAASMNSVAGTADIAVTYSTTTQKVTISKGAGTLQLLCQTGANRHASVFGILGFDMSTDRTGALSYTGDVALLTDVDAQHIIRVDATGWKDDAAGTYTGTPNAAIEKAPDIVHCLLRRVFNKPADLFDSASFVAARTTAPEAIGVWIGSSQTLGDFLAAIELTAQADIVEDGSGKVYFRVYSASEALPSTTPDLEDADYLDFKMVTADDHLYSSVVVLYDEDPSTGQFKRQQISAASKLRYDAIKPREVKTYFVNDVDAYNRAGTLARFATAPTRRASLRTRGKLITSKLGDKVKLSRARALDPIGSMTDEVFRLVNLKNDYSRMESVAVLVEV